MDALIVERVGEFRLEEMRREAASAARSREVRTFKRADARARQAGDNRVRIRIADRTAAGEHEDGKGRLVTRTATMLQDPFLLKELGTRRLDGLRSEAATSAALAQPVPRWRRRAGYSLVRVGLRLLRHPVPADVLERALP